MMLDCPCHMGIVGTEVPATSGEERDMLFFSVIAPLQAKETGYEPGSQD